MYYFDLSAVLINVRSLLNISAKSTHLIFFFKHDTILKRKTSEDSASLQCLAILMVKMFFFMFVLMPFQYPTFCPDSPVYRELFILFFSTTHFHIPLPSNLKHV